MIFEEQFTNFAKPDFPISSYELDGRLLIALGEEASVFDPNQLSDLISELQHHLNRVRKRLLENTL